MSERKLLPVATAAFAGLLFGIGLAVSRMTDPEKVKSFLDVAAIGDGNWDPSLAFVMGGGLIVAMLFYRIARPLGRPLFSLSFSLPSRADIDRPLVIGSAAFGVGWGLSGLCPGPAIAVLGIAPGEFALFAVAMLVGSWAVSFIQARNAGMGELAENVAAE